MMELAKCPKCGRDPLRVNKHGENRPDDGKYVSCKTLCMRPEEFYSPAAWNAMAEREEAYKARIAELNAEIERLKNAKAFAERFSA